VGQRCENVLVMKLFDDAENFEDCWGSDKKDCERIHEDGRTNKTIKLLI